MMRSAKLIALLALIHAAAGCGAPELDADPGDESTAATSTAGALTTSNLAGGPRDFRIELAPAAREALAAGRLQRGAPIELVASFRVAAADAAAAGEILLYATDVALDGGLPADSAADSLSAGAIRIPVQLGVAPSDGRHEVHFRATVLGQHGAGVTGKLFFPEAGPARAGLLLAVDGAGQVKPADQQTIYAPQVRELTADPAKATRALGLGQSLPLPKGAFDIIPVGGIINNNTGSNYFKLFPAECFQAGKLCIAGRVAFDEPRGCTSPIFSQNVSSADCHSFKRHFDAAGNAITGAAQPAQMLRPLAGTVQVRYSVKPVASPLNISFLCGTTTVSTDANGYFLAVVSSCNKPGYLGTASVTYQPVYQVPGSTGTIRTIWPVSDAKSVVPTDQVGSKVWTYTDPNSKVSTDYSLPTLAFSASLGAEPQTNDSTLHTVSAGTSVLLPAAAGDALNYVRQALAAHQNLVELHLRLQTALNGSALDYNKMFVNSPWSSSYTIYLNATWPGGVLGGISLLHPYADAVNHLNLLSDTGVDSHEFSHSIHNAFAATTLQHDYDFANKLTRANGQEYDWGHAGGQYQELGVGLTEGFASGFGQSLLNACGGWNGTRPLGGADPFNQNMWNGVKTCDANDGCNFHHFRWQMVKRGVSEGSTTWNKRLYAMQQLTQQLTAAGHRHVTSNSEDRVAELFCDLLDKNSDVSHAPAAGQYYWPSFTGTVGSILDGACDSLLPVFIVNKQFGASSAENVSLSAPTLISALGSFCPNGCQQTWTYGSAYTKDHLSTATGKLAPQRLMRYLVDTGSLTQADGANLLRTNWMEDSF